VAEIQIDKKQGPSPWVWVAGLVVLALIVWGVMEFTGDGRMADDERETTPAAEQYPTEQQPTQPLPRQEPYTPPAQDPAAPGAPGTAPGTGPGTDTGTPGLQTDPAGPPGNGNGQYQGVRTS
jgi:hypothetical protein